MIKAVSFDYGGVLNRGGTVDAIRKRFCQALGIPLSRYGEIVVPKDKLYRGLITPEEFWQECGRVLNLPIAADAMQRWSETEYNELQTAYYQFAAELRERGIRTAILSNITAMSVPSIRAAGGYDDFDPVILSCEVGLAKPDPAFFQLLLDRLSISANEVIHIDDQLGKVAAARSFGLQAVQATTPTATIAEIEKLLSYPK